MLHRQSTIIFSPLPTELGCKKWKVSVQTLKKFHSTQFAIGMPRAFVSSNKILTPSLRTTTGATTTEEGVRPPLVRNGILAGGDGEVF